MHTTPENDTGLVTGHSDKPQNDTTDRADFTANDGAIAHQIARLALTGHTVIRGDRGDYTVCKYGLTRYCVDYAALVAFAKKVGAA